MFDAGALLSSLDAAGVHVEVEAGDILLSGNRPAAARHLPEIRAHKAELIALLTQAANDSPDTAARWLVTLPEGQRFSASFTPPATLAEVQAAHPGATVEREPDPPPAPPLEGDALAVAHALLRHWGEDDLATVQQYLDALARDPERLRQAFDAAVAAGIATRGPDPDGVALDDVPQGAVCARCSHFRPDPINPPAGLGRCLRDAPASHRAGSCWPWTDAEIHCTAFEDSTNE